MQRHGPSCLKGPIHREGHEWPSSCLADEGVFPEMLLDQEINTMDMQSKNSTSHDLPIRKDLVERVRREIAQGTYETSEKLRIALDRLIDEIED